MNALAIAAKAIASGVPMNAPIVRAIPRMTVSKPHKKPLAMPNLMRFPSPLAD